jgi:hypothetical protein
MPRDNEAYQRTAKENAKQIESELFALNPNVYDHHGRAHFREFWDRAKRIQELFNTLKPLLREDRELLWGQFNEARDKVNRDREIWYSGSADKRFIIEGMIDGAVSRARGDLTEDYIKEAMKTLQKARDGMQDGWASFNMTTSVFKDFTGNPGAMTKEDRDSCWEKWREANDSVWQRRLELCDYNYAELNEKARGAYNTACLGSPGEARDLVRSIQSEMKDRSLKEDHVINLRDWLDRAWQKAHKRSQEEWLSGQRSFFETQIKETEGSSKKPKPIALRTKDDWPTRAATSMKTVCVAGSVRMTSISNVLWDLSKNGEKSSEILRSHMSMLSVQGHLVLRTFGIDTLAIGKRGRPPGKKNG